VSKIKPDISAGDYFENSEGQSVVVLAVALDPQEDWQIVYQATPEACAVLADPETFLEVWGDPKRNEVARGVTVYGSLVDDYNHVRPRTETYPSVDAAVARFEGYDEAVPSAHAFLRFYFPCPEFDAKYATQRQAVLAAEALRERIHSLGRALAKARDAVAYAEHDSAKAQPYLNEEGQKVYAAMLQDAKTKLKELEALQARLKDEVSREPQP
jgi:Sec-independent protein translocase protein TatA